MQMSNAFNDFQILEEFKKNDTGFTEGLFFLGGGKLLESNGFWGQSNLRITRLKTGQIIKYGPPMPPQVFAEGITKWRHFLFQLTWQDGVIYIYNSSSLGRLAIVPNPLEEGWGITTDGASLILSNGSSWLSYMDPSTMAITRAMRVFDDAGDVEGLNELGLAC